MTEEEVLNTIDKLFEIKEEQKKQIKSNIDAWYNGFYSKSGQKLYQIYSTTRYLEDCNQEYKKKGITLNDKDGKWIPPPSPYTVSTKAAGLFNDYLSDGFSRDSYDSYMDLYGGESIEFRKNHHFRCPLLFLLARYSSRNMLISLLMQNGYLTHAYRNKKGPDHVKIPNCEVYYLFEQKLKEYLNSFPIQTKYISNLSETVIAQDFEKFGIELAKSLSKFDGSEDKRVKTEYIHCLMYKLFDSLKSNPENENDTRI
jgi:hypothetical protein